MSRPIAAAAALALFTAGVHTFVGTPEVAAPLLGSTMHPQLTLLLYACWHLVTASLVLSAFALLYAWRRRNSPDTRPLVVFISLLWTAFGLVFIAVAVFSPGEHLLLKLPQWILLLPVGILGLWGSKRLAQPSAGRTVH